ncbi:cytochrome-c peroxidase [Desulfocurvibacter africanus]|uniref:Cytochrome-c peroxidase n=1 Tax=Desulfocurvibacter africanus subsp. africanus str. Walvis Bay TaxID=690850 RepID=F3YW35_DESAF|nr:cytochrome-c peroxidase [Desulfocurvibacter africanus]EGJ49065.1 Cytochrome-c peroxidase [Desulfocurvibacter africanus subsp. africanus str. Walvis Bay]
MKLLFLALPSVYRLAAFVGVGIVLGAVLAPGTGLAQKTMQQEAAAIFRPIPENPPKLPGNIVTPVKVELGRLLYFDPRLSASQLISCQTCHNVGLGGADLQETSIGHGWQKGPRNAPTTFNSVFNVAQFWDGRAKDLAEQSKGPVQAAVEMNNTPDRVVATLASIPQYVDLFAKAFPGQRNPVSFENMAQAIEAFEATLLTPGAPLDAFITGDESALTPTQQEGLRLFIDSGCSDCHYGINLGGMGYYPFGVAEAPSEDVRPTDDTGRFVVTNTASDKYVFKSPILRNVAITQPYFHSGKVWRLRDAVQIMGSSQLGFELEGKDADIITEFLKALTGKQPEVAHPILPPSTESTPKPMTQLLPEKESGKKG